MAVNSHGDYTMSSTGHPEMSMTHGMKIELRYEMFDSSESQSQSSYSSSNHYDGSSSDEGGERRNLAFGDRIY